MGSRIGGRKARPGIAPGPRPSCISDVLRLLARLVVVITVVRVTVVVVVEHGGLVERVLTGQCPLHLRLVQTTGPLTDPIKV